MSTTPWMPLFIADYRADTAHLSAAQHGAYLLLIMHYWQQGGLPDDDAQLARIACMSTTEWRRHRPVIRDFFGEGWRHGRIDREMNEVRERIEARSRAGKKGNQTRWNRSQTDRNAIAKGIAKASPPQPQPHPLRGSRSMGEASSTSQGRGTSSTRPALAVVNGGSVNGGEADF